MSRKILSGMHSPNKLLSAKALKAPAWGDGHCGAAGPLGSRVSELDVPAPCLYPETTPQKIPSSKAHPFPITPMTICPSQLDSGARGVSPA